MSQIKHLLMVVYYLVLAFPKFFARAFSFLPYIGVWIKYLPEMIELSKAIGKMAKNEWTEYQIRKDIEGITKVFDRKGDINAHSEAARNFNQIFRS